MMLDKKLSSQLAAAGIANRLDQETFLLKARQDARDAVKSRGYDDLAQVPQETVDALGYKGENAKSRYLSDLIEAIYKERTQKVTKEDLSENQKKLLDTLPSI